MSATVTTFEATHAILLRQFAADRMKVRHQRVKGEAEVASHVITLERQWGKLTTVKLVFLDDSPKVKWETQFVLVHQHDGSRCTRASLHNVWPFVKSWNDAGCQPTIRLIADAKKVTVVLEGSISPCWKTTIESCSVMLKQLEDEYRLIRAGIGRALSREETPVVSFERTRDTVAGNRESSASYYTAKFRAGERTEPELASPLAFS